MKLDNNYKFSEILAILNGYFVRHGKEVKSKFWQAVKTPMPMIEILNVSLEIDVPLNPEELKAIIKPNLPWADIHFEERVSGLPLNPGESYKQWPFYKMDKDMRRVGDKFSHTYMERFWPKFAGIESSGHAEGHDYEPMKGIRYPYGDLSNITNLLANDPLTRQAFLPVFFPEDTGNVMNERIPCTIGYQFIMRDEALHMVYYIRSCDYIRHFKDDIYLAMRLLGWVHSELIRMDEITWGNIKLGTLTMHITSLHVFQSDMYGIRKEFNKGI